MSSGGSNYSTGATGGGNQVSVDAPASNPVSYTNASAPAPGGKGGFPSAQSPYAQQQPQVYMPPQQPSMYQQAFPQQQQRSYIQSNFYAPQQQYAGNAYARRMPMYSPPSPIQARPPIDEMNYAPGGLEQAPQQLMSDSWRRRPGLEYAGPTNQMPQYGGPGAVPVEATRGVASDNINNPAYQQQLAASNMTDYQRLMQQKQAASQPQQNQYGLGGLNPISRAPSDLEIANSLGYKGAGSAEFMTDMRARMPHEYEAENAANNAKAREYLNSIGYGQSGFDASKYEVKRQPVSTGPRTGLGALLGGASGANDPYGQLPVPDFKTNPMIG